MHWCRARVLDKAKTKWQNDRRFVRLPRFSLLLFPSLSRPEMISTGPDRHMGAIPSSLLSLFVYLVACDKHISRGLLIYSVLHSSENFSRGACVCASFVCLLPYQRCTLRTTAKKKPRRQRDVIAFSYFLRNGGYRHERRSNGACRSCSWPNLDRCSLQM